MTWVGRGRRHKTVLLWALVMSWQSSLLLADHQQSFRDGIDAADGDRWADVERYMRAAINERPQPGGNVKIYGMRFEVYAPYYYLGLARYHLGDCRQAVEAWDRSEGYGELRGRQSRELEEKRQECRDRLPPPTQPPPIKPPPTQPPPTQPPPTQPPPAAPPALDAGKVSAAETRLREAQGAARRVEDLRADAAYSEVFRDRGLSSRLTQAKARVETAGKTLEAGRVDNDPDAVEQAATLASQALDELAGLRQEITNRRTELLLAELSRLAVEARAVLADASKEAAPAVQRERDALASQLRLVESANGRADPAELALLRDQTVRRTASLRAALDESEPALVAETPPAPAPKEDVEEAPPKSLRAAAEAFLGADFQGTLKALGEAADLKSPKARATALLLSAAAKHALFLESGGEASDLESGAAADVEACRSLDPELKPSAKWFSPGFVRFFQKT